MPATIAQVAITIETRILLRSSQAADQGHSHGRQKEQEWKLAGQGRDFLLLSYRAKDSGSRNHLQHADHKAFGALLGPVIADVMVIDFWGNE